MLHILIFLTSLSLVASSIPAIINLAFKKRLFDNPGEFRKVHKRIVPYFGGIAIFTGFFFTSSLFIRAELLPEYNSIMAGGLILFMIGLNDDIVGLKPLKKFSVQFVSAFIITVVADIRILTLNGFMGIDELNLYVSIGLSILVIVGLINAFNLIDGIDGLAASLGILSTLTYAYLFLIAGYDGWSYLSISLTGALIGFLFFNVSPAKIFMGDSGSLLIGFIVVVLSLKFMQISNFTPVSIGYIPVQSSMALTLAIFIIPIFDTLRVFTLRMLHKRSPFIADSNHIHHRLLFIGLSHMQSTLILVVVNVLFIVLAVSLQDIGDTNLIGIIAITALTVNGLLSLYIEHFKKGLLKPVDPAPSEERNYGEEILEKIKEKISINQKNDN